MKRRCGLFWLLASGFWILLSTSGCQLVNNKWIRVRRTNPDVALIKLRAPNFTGPKQRVEKFFRLYGLKDWEDIEKTLTRYSDIRFMKTRLEADFNKYGELLPKLVLDEPVFNKAQDRAQVKVRFEIEKIRLSDGKLFKIRGAGSFVLTDVGGWDIIGYVGDPFWGESP